MEQGYLNNFSSFNFEVNSDILWLILSILTLIFIAFSWAIFYHWHKFGRKVVAIGLAEVIYLAGSIFLILGAAASVILFAR